MAAAGALSLVALACSANNDAAVFETGKGAALSGGPADSNPTPSTTAMAPRTTVVAQTLATPVVTTPTAPSVTSSATFPAGGQLVVNFAFSATDSGRVHNPYIAAWVEDGSGRLVKTISLWFDQSGQGTKWLSDLRGWAATSGRMVDQVTSGSTRNPGAYSVAWDGLDEDGVLVSVGQYRVFVEAARENGPYELTSAPITIGAQGFTVAIPSKGELTALSATLEV